MKLMTLIFATILVILSSYSVMAIMSNPWSKDLINQDKNSVKQGKEAGILGVPNKLSGDIFSGNYIRVGINNLGTLGVTNGSNIGDPGVGFQASIDTPFKWPSTESVAIGWWGEGYFISYGFRKAYWQPGFGYPCSECNITPISNKVIINIDAIAIKETKVKTKDGNLTMTFRFRFLKDLPVLSLETTINNTGTVPVTVIYKRIVDWDVCANNGNNWASTGTEAYAWGYCNPLRGSIQLTISGHDGISKLGAPLNLMPAVNYVDLYAWDDQNISGPANPVQSSTPIVGDYNTGIYYDIGALSPGQSKTVYTIYQISRYGQN